MDQRRDEASTIVCGGDPNYARIGELATNVCRTVDPSYTDRFLAAEEEAKQLAESTGL